MKKLLGIGVVLILAALLTWAITAGPSLAQEEIDDHTTAPGDVSSAPLDAAVVLVDWPSSAALPEGQVPRSVPDRDFDESPQADITALYDSNYRMAGSALRPRTNNVDWTSSGGGGCLYASGGTSSTVFNVPLHLPQGSIVKYVRMYYYDTNASFNTMGWFTVYDLFGNIKTEYSMFSSGDVGNNYATTVEITETIDYNAYSYVLNWRPMTVGSDIQLCGFNIYYDAPNSPVFLPMISQEND